MQKPWIIKFKKNSYEILNQSKNKKLIYIIDFLLEDFFQFYDTNLIKSLNTSEEIGFNSSFIVINQQKKTIYICDEMHSINYLDSNISNLILIEDNKIPSTKISKKNFIQLLENWQKINLLKPPFALIWQDEQDWIYAKAFGCEEDMDAFIKKHYKDNES